MQADLIKGIYFRVSGEVGRTNGLPWDVLFSMGSHLQNLITALAKYDLENVSSPQLANFQIELFDYKPGSAVPAFRLRPIQQQVIGMPIDDQRKIVAVNLDNLLKIAATGDYQEINTLYSLPELKNEVVKEVFDFVNATGDSPLSVVKPTRDGKFRNVYTIKKFKKELYNELYTSFLDTKIAYADQSPEEAYGKIILRGKKKKIIDLYKGKDKALSFAPSAIIAENKTYVLHSPLLCIIHKEDDCVVIENNLMDLYASGVSEEDAEKSFYQEFDIAFTRLNEITDDNLSERLKRAKAAMNLIIKEIIPE